MSGHDAAHQGRITRNAGVLVVLTMVSRVGGLIRDLCITHFFGASGLTDVFYMAFTIPNVLRRLVAEGTMTAVVQPAYQAVRTERYKYIHYLELPGMDELYDLQADPFELDNIIATASGRAVLPALQAELARLQAETGYQAKPGR